VAPDAPLDAAAPPAAPGPATLPAPAAGARPLAPHLLPWSARWGAVLGCLSALLLVAAPFLPWVRVRDVEATAFGKAVAEAAAEEGPGAGNEGLAQLGQRLASAHELTGLDLVQWSREARARLADARSEAAASTRERDLRARAWALLTGLVLGMGAGALLLACYLVWHRFARFRPPLQVLAGLLSMAGLGCAMGVIFAWRLFEGLLQPGPGHLLLLLGGVGLLVSLIATVRVLHLPLVFLSLLVCAAAIALLGWVYLGAPGL
jgi:hypothetical protein